MSNRDAAGAMKAEIVCGVDAWSCATEAYAAKFRETKAVNLTLDAKSSPSVPGDIGSIDLPSPRFPRMHEPHLRPRQPPTPRGEQAYGQPELKPRWVVIENVIHMRV